jgi:hypothetical protein
MRLDIDPEQQGWLTVLNGPCKDARSVRILSASGRRITICCENKPAIGEVVKLTWGGNLVLADVLGAARDGGGTVLHVRHALRTSDIDAIQERWS